MSLKDGIIQAAVSMGVVGAIAFVIIGRVMQNNPKFAEFISKFKPGSIYEKAQENPITDKIEQVYDEKRTMM